MLHCIRMSHVILRMYESCHTTHECHTQVQVVPHITNYIGDWIERVATSPVKSGVWLWVCVCMCVHVYMYVCVYVRVCEHMYMHVCIHLFADVETRMTWISAYIGELIERVATSPVKSSVGVCMGMCMCLCMCVCVCVCEKVKSIRYINVFTYNMNVFMCIGQVFRYFARMHSHTSSHMHTHV